MVRKLTMAVALALGGASFNAYGLGLGDIQTNSGLNEPFRARIGLLSVGEGELEGLRVRLASIADFERAGVGRPLFLSSLRFEPKAVSGGNAVIEVTSDFPIREPFLNFLIEVNWPKGRLIREYTVLLDPPATTLRRPAPVTAPSVARQPAPAAAPARPAAPAPAPVQRQPAAGEYGPVQANETMWTIASNLRPSDVSTEQMILAIQRANPDAFIGGNVNLLKKGQILRIPGRDEILNIGQGEARAQFLAQQEQWLASLQTQAAGVAAGDAPDAAAAAVDEEAQLRIASPRPDGEGKAGAGEDDAARPTSDDLEQELMLAREKAESSRLETDNLRTQVEDLEKQVGDMQRLLSLKDEQLAQLQASVQQEQEAAVQPEEALPPLAEPEAEPSDQEVAAQAPTDAEPAPADQAPTDAAPTDDTAVADQQPPAADTEPSATAEAEPPATAEAEPPATAEAEPPATAEAEPPATAEQAEPTVAEDKGAAGLYDPATVKTPEPAPEPAPPAEPETTEPVAKAPQKAWYEQLPVLGGIGALAVLLLGWLLMRGRNKAPEAAEAADGTEALAAAAAGTAAAGAAGDEVALDPDTEELAEAVADLQPESDSLPQSELAAVDGDTASDLEAVQDDTGEVDPVSEADVYIAYGRYQQAEDLLKQALDKDPDRLAYKHKLLEVLYATKKAPDFATVAQSMVNAGQDGVDPEAWVRIQEMGRDLDPDSVLFQPVGDMRPTLVETDVPDDVAGAEAASDLADAEDEVDELSELVSELKLDDTPISEPSDLASEADLSLELDELTREVEKTVDAIDSDSGQVKADDLDSLALDLPTVQADERTLKQVAGADSLDMDTLDLPDNSLEVPTESLDDDDAIPSLMNDEITRAGEVSEQEMDSELQDLSELTTLDTEVEQASDTSGGLEPLDLDSVFDKDAVAGNDAVANVAENVAGADAAAAVAADVSAVGDEATVDLDLGEPVDTGGDGFDDVETKLDLARAYVEMGDAEGARSILEEVSDEGDDSQKSQAKQILAEIEA